MAATAAERQLGVRPARRRVLETNDRDTTNWGPVSISSRQQGGGPASSNSLQQRWITALRHGDRRDQRDRRARRAATAESRTGETATGGQRAATATATSAATAGRIPTAATHSAARLDSDDDRSNPGRARRPVPLPATAPLPGIPRGETRRTARSADATTPLLATVARPQ